MHSNIHELNIAAKCKMQLSQFNHYVKFEQRNPSAWCLFGISMPNHASWYHSALILTNVYLGFQSFIPRNVCRQL